MNWITKSQKEKLEKKLTHLNYSIIVQHLRKIKKENPENKKLIDDVNIILMELGKIKE